jgi:hypothetical protein
VRRPIHYDLRASRTVLPQGGSPSRDKSARELYGRTNLYLNPFLCPLTIRYSNGRQKIKLLHIIQIAVMKDFQASLARTAPLDKVDIFRVASIDRTRLLG